MFPVSLKILSDKERHDYILKTYMLHKNYTGDRRKYKRDIDVIREHHRFLWDEDKDTSIEDSWELQLVKRYYDKLFKEYCIADLSRHKENKVALRWRTEAEVVAGIGQFQCGSRKCLEKEQLRSWEVNFAYREEGENKNALVKLRLCPEHSEQLNYTSKKREIKRLKHTERRLVKEAKREKRKSLKTKRKEKVECGEEIEETAQIICAMPSENQTAGNDESPTTSAEDKRDDLEISDDVWNNKTDVDLEPISRESEFERYLEDLLL